MGGTGVPPVDSSGTETGRTGTKGSRDDPHYAIPSVVFLKFVA